MSVKRAEIRRAAREGVGSTTVCVAHMHRDQTCAAFTSALRRLEWYDRKNGQYLQSYIEMGSGPLLSNARNQVVQAFLETSCDWLWFLDDDMVFEPQALEQIVALADVEERPFIGSLYFGGGRSAIIRPHIFTVFRDENGNYATEVRLDFPTDQPFQCDAVGAGSILVHRRVFEAVHEKWSPHTAQPWFAETEHGMRPFGEDVTFCLRARGCGIPIWVDPRIEFGHVKQYVINETVWRAQRERLAVLSESDLHREHLQKLGVLA